MDENQFARWLDGIGRDYDSTCKFCILKDYLDDDITCDGDCINGISNWLRSEPTTSVSVEAFKKAVAKFNDELKTGCEQITVLMSKVMNKKE